MEEILTVRSLHGQAKSVEDSEKILERCLPTDGDEKTYRVNYAVHEILSAERQQEEGAPARFIGLITLKSMDASALPLPEDLTVPAADASTTLTATLAYSFLPIGWGKGYATESINAVLEACKRAGSFWAPFPKLYVRALVNDENAASQRVMEKTEMRKRGFYEWTGEATFLAGKWRKRDRLHVYGMYLLE